MANNPFFSDKRSISSYAVGSGTINCDSAIEIGMEAMQKVAGKTFRDVQLHRKDRVLPFFH